MQCAVLLCHNYTKQQFAKAGKAVHTKAIERRNFMVSYALSVTIFALGVLMSAMIVYYIVNGNKKYKDVDPFEGEK